MPSPETIERFIAMVEQNDHVRACETFYAENATMQENQAAPRVGRAAHVASEKKLLQRVQRMKSRCVRPVFIDCNNVVIRWVFQFDWIDGTYTHLDELAYQQWEGEFISEEIFFYDPAQRVPKMK